MGKPFRLLSLGTLVLMAASSVRAQIANPCADMPSPILKLIQTKFSGWTAEQLSELGSEDQQLWVKAHGNQCPGTAVGHFESSDRLTYALLLVRHSNPTGGYKIVVFNRVPNRDAYAWKLVDHWDTSTYGAVVLSKVPPGHYSDYEDVRISVTTKLDGVLLEFIERGAMLYYWTASRYKYVRISG